MKEEKKNSLVRDAMRTYSLASAEGLELKLT